jgi:hypothetical protein
VRSGLSSLPNTVSICGWERQVMGQWSSRLGETSAGGLARPQPWAFVHGWEDVLVQSLPAPRGRRSGIFKSRSHRSLEDSEITFSSQLIVCPRWIDQGH